MQKLRDGEYMNAFSLNLTYLKKHAKYRLKRVRSGSVEDLRWLLALHPQPLLPADSVKLADVHLALARELGVSSWSKLLSHIDSLDRNKSSDGAPLPALDNDLQTLHVRCGHDIQQTLEQAGFSGDFLPYIEPLCIGPLFLDEKTLSAIRAEYVSDRLLSEMKEVEKSLEQIKSEAKQATSKLLDNDYQRIVLWVEHDNYDQLMLIRSLYLLSYQNTTKVEIIEVSTFPGRERFIGLGQLPPEALRALWNSRKKVSVEHITVATELWPAFCSKSPLKLVEYYHKVDQGLFPNIRAVIFRHLQELPHIDSKYGLVERLTIDILKNEEEGLEFNELFKRYMKLEPLVYLGDLMYWALIKPLTEGPEPILQAQRSESKDWYNNRISLSKSTHNRTSKVADKWVGGIHLTPNNFWSWDHQDLATISHYN